VAKVVKYRKLEGIVKDLPTKLTKLAKDETKTLPKISIYNNKIIIGNSLARSWL